jgi:hypothetical protein
MSKSRFFQKEKEKQKEMRLKRQFNRQQMVRCLPLPYDVAEIINSFLFYDYITAKTRRFKKLICKKFKNAYSSRACPNEYWFEKEGNNPDNCENWNICMTDRNIIKPLVGYLDIRLYERYREISFNATSCKSCGNYKYSHSAGYSSHLLDDALNFGDLELAAEMRSFMPDRIRCECNLFWWM